MVRKLHNFDEWIDYFRYWQDSIGLPQGEIRKFKFEAKFGSRRCLTSSSAITKASANGRR